MEKMEYGLTFPQKNIWLVENYNKGTALNIIAGSVKINRGFDEEKCEIAINKVIEENVAMRTRIKEEKGKVMQYFAPYSYEKIEVVDLSSLSKKEILEYIDGLTFQSFFAKDKKLYDFKILRTGKNSGYIFMCIHHIISDAWSCSKIVKSLTETLETIGTRSENSEEKIVPEYTEYIEKEEEYKNSDKYVKDEEFWNEYLKGFSEVVSLKDKKKTSSLKANRYSVKLDKDLNDRITNYCKENKISPYALFLTAISTYIYRVKDKNDFVLGTPVLNRANFKEKQMLGMFVSTLPLRVKVEENIKFLDLAKEISKNNFSMFRHQKYPYSKMLEYVHKNSDIKNNLYNIAVSFQNAKTDIMDNDKYETNWTFSKALDDEMQIHISDIDDTGIYSINYDYKEELFEKIEVEYIHLRLMSIIENAIKDVDVDVENIEIMPESEKNKILYEFNNTKKEYPKDKTVIELFEEQVNKTPDNVALVFEGKEMTYKELNEKANSLAHYLVENENVKPNDVVGLIFSRSFDIIIGILAVLKSGAAYIPIDPTFPKDRIKYMLQNSEAKLAITNIDINIKEINLSIKNIKDVENSKNDNLNIKNSLEDLFFILYTSGSTGRPKGVEVTQLNMLNLVWHFINSKIYEKSEVAVSLTTISFDIFIYESLVSIINGLKLVIANEEEQKIPSRLNKLIENFNIDLLQMTPTRFKLLIENINEIPNIKKVKNIVLAGEQLPLSLKNEIVSWGARVYNGYGPTECTVFASFTDCSKFDKISIGVPLNNLHFYILDKKERLLPLGCMGELYIGGFGVSKGYINNETLTKKSFKTLYNERVYASGDICLVDFNLLTYCFGRSDNQIKIRGLRIETSEIEEVIKKEESVKECVVAKQVYNEKEYLVAFVTSNKFIDTIQIKKNISRVLPMYMVPNVIFKLEEMPYTQNGKIDVKKLSSSKGYYDKKQLKSREITKPTNDIQQCIYEYINNIGILGYDISIYDNFFEIGLDSLNLMELLIYINNKYNIELAVKDLMNNPTISDLSIIIQGKLEKNQVKPISINKKKSDNTEYFELTQSQLRIFSTYTSNPDNIIYNMPVEVKLDKDIDCEKLQRCIEEIINENDAFSLLMRVVDSNIMFTSKNEYIKIDCINEILEERYLELRTDFVRPFDLLNERLFRVEIYKTEKNVYLLFDIHHIICDGISLNIFFNDIIKRYNGVVKDKKNGSFKNYLLSRIDPKNTPEYKSAKNFFNKMFDQGPISTCIKPDHKRKNTRTYNGEKLGVLFDSNIMSKVHKYVVDNKLTYNTLFLSILNIVLSKYTCKNDVVLGVATMGRKKLEDTNTIGMFVETLPFKTTVAYEKTPTEYLENVKNTMFEILDNDIYPIDELITDLSISKSNNRNALFDIMYNYQNMGFANLDIEGKKVSYTSLLENITKFDMTFNIMAFDNNFQLEIEYNKDLYNKKTIRNLLNIYLNTLENFISMNTNQNLSKLKIISKKEEEYILKDYNKGHHEFKSDERVITSIFENVVKENLNKIAVVYYNERLTYKELDEMSNQIANMLIKNGIKKNDVVAIMLDKSIELLPGILGILKTGASYLPIDYELPNERIQYMLENSNAKCIVSKKQIYREVRKVPVVFIDKDNEDLKSMSKEKLKININEKDTAYVMYTSGSTGKPKGVMIPNKGVVRLVKNTNYINVNEDDRVLLSGTIVFDASVFEMWLSILNGLTLYIINKEDLLDPSIFEEYITQNNITITLLTASLFNQLVIYKKDLFKNFNYVVTGGDVMNSKSANAIVENSKNVKLINAYGPTENSVISSTYSYKNMRRDEVPIGRPINCSTCYIVDEYGNLLPKGVPGELVVGGDGVANGYINNEKLTNERFVNLPFTSNRCYKTGDMAKFSYDYNIDFIGRIDNQVKIRGYRIELDEIKSALFNIDKVKDSYVRIIDNNKNKINSDKVILAYYVSDFELDVDYLKKELKKVLPSYMIPNNIIRMKSFPLTINGKIDKEKLPIEITNKKRKIILPRNDVEKKLYNIWQELLPNIEISISDNFFDIGGDSLLATQFVTKSMVNGLKYTYSDIYNYPTIMQLAESNYSILEDIYGISRYKYSKINEYLDKKYFEKNNLKIIKTGGVLLTGVTGFLGAHVLANLLDNTESNIYCIVRNKNDRTVRERVIRKLNFFFGKKYDKYIGNRIVVIEGDITKNNFGLRGEKLSDIIDNVTNVIHVAAMVKHYGVYNKFINLNIESTEKIANFCLLNNKRMIYISTLSNSGNMLEGGQIDQDRILKETKYDEKSMYIGQKLYNAYVYSKYMGEYKVLRKSLNGLEACIIRTGNLTGRYTDGKYQPNVEENAFANRIKSFISLEMIPKSMLDMYVEYTPIDYAADAIVKISKLEKLPAVIHLFNHNHVYMPKLIEILKKINIELNIVDDEKFKELIERKLKNHSKDIDGIIVDLNSKKEIKYLSNIIVDSKYSIDLLKKLDFEWPDITSEYIIRYLEYLENIDFIRLDNKKKK